jgi:hypothetical protein
MRLKIAVIMLLAASALVLAGCSGGGSLSSGGSNSGIVSLSVSYPQDADSTESGSSYSVSYYTIDLYEVLFTGDAETKGESGLIPAVPTTRIDYPQTVATIVEVPVGPKLLQVYGYDQENNPLLYASLYIEVQAGENPPIDVDLLPYGPTPTPTPTLGPPVVSSISPDYAKKGDTVTIFGENFGDVQTRATSEVFFSGVPAVSYTSWSNTQIQCVVPNCPDGPIYVVVDGVTSNQDVLFARSRSWDTTPQQLDQGSGFNPIGGMLPRIALDPATNDAICVFQYKPGSTTPVDIFASFFTSATETWSNMGGIDDPLLTTSDALNPKIAMAANHSAYAVFEQTSTVYSAFYDPNRGGWVTAGKVDTSSIMPQVAMNSLGRPFVVYEKVQQVVYNTVAPLTTIFNELAGVNLSTQPAMPGLQQVVIDKNDNVIFIFLQDDAGYQRLYARVLDASGTLKPISNAGDPSNLYFTDKPEITVGGDGIVSAIYLYGGDVYVSRFNPANNTWATPVEVSVGFDGGADNTDKWNIAADSEGNLIAAYTFANESLYVRHYDAATGQWGDQLLIHSDFDVMNDPYTRIALAMDKQGNALLAFSSVDALFEMNLWASYYQKTARGTWSSLMNLGTTGSGNSAAQADIVFDNNQNAICVFTQWLGSNAHVHAKLFR